jgi:VWFA-related protein
MHRANPRLRQFLCALALSALSIPCVVFGQDRAPSAVSGVQQDEVLRISTDLVQTDVVVLDKESHVVSDLQRDQFELLVDGQPQPLSFFESVEAGSAKEAAQLAAARGATVAPATSSPATTGRVLIFFVDDLHLSQQGIQRTRELLTRFVNELGPNDQALIVSPSGQIGFLQQLSNNKVALQQAIGRLNFQMRTDTGRRGMTAYEARAIDQGQRDVLEYKIKELLDDAGVTRNPMDPNQGLNGGFGGVGNGGGSNVGNSSLPNSSTNNTNVVSTSGPRGAPDANGGSGQVGGTDLVNRRASAEAQVKSNARNVLLQEQAVNQGMLAALENLARGAASLPGRKLVFFISDGFILDTKNGDLSERLRRVIDASSRSGVVIYTVDARGLTADGSSASTDTFSDIAGSTPGTNTAADHTGVALAESRQTKEVLQTLASETGGRAILNRNDLESGIRKVLQETASYYVLAWKPAQPSEAGGPKFKTIKVSIKGRPELVVRSRRGFYNAPLPLVASAAPATTGPEAAKAAETELRRAISDPFLHRELSLSTYHTFTNTPPGEYKLTTFADISGYQVGPGSDGKTGGEVDVAMVVLDNTGKAITNISRKLKVTPSTGAANQPVKFVGTFPAGLAPGLYQVRAAVRDAHTGRTGTLFDWLEIPEFKAGKLTMSSLFLSDDTAKTSGDSADKSKATANVTRRFTHASNLVLQFYIYNATAGANNKPDVESTITLLSNGQTLTSSPLPPIPAESMKDSSRLFHSAQFPLEGFPVGTYTLQITVNDRVAKSSTSQQVNFTVQ